MSDQNRCDIRSKASFHVEYTIHETNDGDIEVRNTTHVDKDAEPGDYDVNMGWVGEVYDSKAYLHLFTHDDQTFYHQLSPQTLFQLADMFNLMAIRVSEYQLDSDSKELAEQVETARMYQPLPFELLPADDFPDGV